MIEGNAEPNMPNPSVDNCDNFANSEESVPNNNHIVSFNEECTSNYDVKSNDFGNLVIVECSDNIDTVDFKGESAGPSAPLLEDITEDESQISISDEVQLNTLNITPESLMTVPVTINGVATDALVDTGATISIVKQSLVANHIDLSIPNCDLQTITGLGGHEIRPLAIINLKFSLGSLLLDCKFVVVLDNVIKHSVILGDNFFCKYKVQLDMKNGIMTGDSDLGNWEIYSDCTTVQTVVRNMPVYADCNVQIARSESVLVPVYIDAITPTHDTNTDYYFCSDEVNSKKYEYVSGEEGIIQFKNGKSVILMHKERYGSKDIDIIRANEPVGLISTIIDIEVNIVHEPISDIVDELDIGNLEKEELNSVLTMFLERELVFSKGDLDIGCAGVTSHKIVLHDDTPIRQKPRRFPEPVNKELERQCEELRKMDIIKCSSSPYSSPIVPVRKKDGSLRMCIDYRSLNSITKADRFPIPSMNDLIFGLHGMKFFTTIDLKKGYYHVPLHKDSTEYTAFSTYNNHYEFLRLPFGLKNAPGAFQREMQQVLSTFDGKQVVVYLDDVLVMSKTFTEHLDLVSRVLSTFIKYGMKVNHEKCHWFPREVSFLGHIISPTGMRKSDSYMKTVTDYPKPKTTKDLRSFLGLINFQRKFISNCSELCKPLSRLTSGPDKRLIVWTPELEQVFADLKTAMADTIELAYPDYDSEHKLQLTTDASGIGSGACLSQVQTGEVRVIAFASMCFSPAQCEYSVIERELAAIRWAVHTFRCFLYGIPFMLFTDHRPLVYMTNMAVRNARIMRTMNELSEYEFEVRYKPGKCNTIADTLSRLGISDCTAEEINQNALPEGIKVLKFIDGGGDSLVDSLFTALEHYREAHDPSILTPISALVLREAIIDKLLNDPSRYSYKIDKSTKNRIRLLRLPGQFLDADILPVFCDLYHIDVWVHYGGLKPVIYSCTDAVQVCSTQRIHIQCVSGIHYNSLVENKLFQVPVSDTRPVEYPFSDEVADVLDTSLGLAEVECSVAQSLPVQLPCNSWHSGSAVGRTVINFGGSRHCALLDTGAQISVLGESTWQTISQNDDLKSEFQSGYLLIKSVGVNTSAHGAVQVPFSFDDNTLYPGTFAIVPDAAMPYCAIIGADLIKGLNLSLNFQCRYFKSFNGLTEQSYSFLPTVSNEYHYFELSFVQLLDDDPDQVPALSGSLLLSLDQIKLAQANNYTTRLLYKHVHEKRPLSRWKQRCLVRFKKYFSNFCTPNGVLCYKHADTKMTFIVPFGLLVEIALQLHFQVGHLGRNKLIDAISKHVWHPSISEVASDLCNSCPTCQLYKVSAQKDSPPMIKINASQPFDLVTADLIQLPRTSSGSIGCLVVLDHFSKWLVCVPITNKRAETIANIFLSRVLPVLPTKPNRILTDNGKEFSSDIFASLCDQYGITHVFSTPYKPQSNGAVERVNRTIGEMLRVLVKQPQSWDRHLPDVVMNYNHSWHSQIKMSPADCLLRQAHPMNATSLLSNPTKFMWKAGHPSFKSFRVGDFVLRKLPIQGHGTVNKFLPRFEGPFVVRLVRDNGVTYEISQERSADSNVCLRVHHTQLKLWHFPPKYIVQSPSYADFYRNVDNVHGLRSSDCLINADEHESIIDLPILPLLADTDSSGSGFSGFAAPDNAEPLGLTEHDSASADLSGFCTDSAFSNELSVRLTDENTSLSNKSDVSLCVSSEVPLIDDMLCLNPARRNDPSSRLATATNAGIDEKSPCDTSRVVLNRSGIKHSTPKQSQTFISFVDAVCSHDREVFCDVLSEVLTEQSSFISRLESLSEEFYSILDLELGFCEAAVSIRTEATGVPAVTDNSASLTRSDHLNESQSTVVGSPAIVTEATVRSTVTVVAAEGNDSHGPAVDTIVPVSESEVVLNADPCHTSLVDHASSLSATEFLGAASAGPSAESVAATDAARAQYSRYLDTLTGTPDLSVEPIHQSSPFTPTDFHGFGASQGVSERIKRLQLVRQRLSLSPLKQGMEEAYSIIEEYRRRGRARALGVYRHNVENLLSTEITNNISDFYPGTSGPVTRSQGNVPEYSNVQGTPLEYISK